MTGSARCREFLLKHRLLSSQYDAGTIITAFLHEMDEGLSGRKSSLAMIPSHITIPNRAPKNEKIIVLDAGGTNFRVALVGFDGESKPRKEYFTNYPMPGIDREVKKEEFFNLIADYIEPVLRESDRLGFCFSYPALIDRQRDGTLLYWTKEIKAPEVVGRKILAGIADALKRRGLSCPGHMGLLNDTIASLLAGVTATRFSADYKYLGFILGTGTNTAYVEKHENIIKETELAAGGMMAINCESANFDAIDRGDIDIAFDATTSGPGKSVLEKMVSGGYLGALCRHILVFAAEEGLLSADARGRIDALDTSSAKYVSGMIAPHERPPEPFAGCGADDMETMRTLLAETVDRAALLTAANMAAPVVKSTRDGGGGKYCISADGSVYFKLYSFRERTESYLADILKPYSADVSVVHIDEAPIIGTAVAGLAS